MQMLRYLLPLLALPLFAADPNVKPDDVAGNEEVKKIMESRPGRGVMRDDTPPQKPDDTVKLFKTRSDVAIDLVAHEPEVTQPLYLSFDSRGRLWVAQYRQYQFPAGLKIVSYDQHLRAKFDKVPQPPPHGVKGADRISVHEDTNGDGLYDTTKIVIDGLNIATAAIKGAGGIWVMNPPYLLFYADANDDDIPDGDPRVELSGFGLEDTHSVASSLQWGPDGWLYGATGSTTTGDVSSATTKHVKWEGQHIWRFHPKKKTFQIYAEGGGNTFSLDIDSKGRFFSGTNGGGTRGMHYELGSYGVKNWGKHGPPMNPYAFGFFDHMKSEGDKRRFPQAFVVYEGGLLGSSYEGRIIAPNALANLTYVSERIAEGSTFRTKDAEDLMSTTDRWFRPVDVKAGPDGCVYIADWYDTRLSHVSPVDDWSKGDGRIYRVRPKSGAPVLKPFNLHTASGDELVGYLSHSNKWFRKQAALEIGWRELKDLAPKLKELALKQDNPNALDALFALDQLDGADDAFAADFLARCSRLSVSGKSNANDTLKREHQTDAYVRRWLVRMVGERGSKWPEALKELPKLAQSEQHLEVQTQLAASAKRLPASTALPILKALLGTKDERLSLMLWWLLEAKCESDRDAVLALFEDKASWKAQTLVKNLAKRWAMAGGDLNLQSCTKLVAIAPDNKARGLAISGISEAFEGGELPALPEALAKALGDHLKQQSGGDLTLAIRSGDKDAIKKGLSLLKDKSAPVAKRAAVALVFAELGKKEALDAIAPVFSAGGNESLKRALLPAVAKFDDHKVVRAMLDGWEQRMAGNEQLREAALRLMAGRKEWAKMLLAQVDAWQVPAKHFTPDIVRQLSVFSDAEINAAIEKHWKGLLAVAPTEEITKEEARLKTVLKGGSGDPVKGKVIFSQRCAVCHKLFDEGNVIGPDLTGYERGSLDFWLHNILTPSLEIREGFGAYIVETKSGQVLTGMMSAQNAKSITLRDVANQLTQVKLEDIKTQTASPMSLMPPALLTGLSEAEVRDFFAYVMKEP